MYSLNRWTCLLAGIFWAHCTVGLALAAPANGLRARATASNTACALASSASAAFAAAQPSAAQAEIPANLAYDCLQSVPNYPEPALNLIAGLRTYLEFQSDKEYLRKPPSGYLFPGIDLDQELNSIQKTVENGEYTSEYDMQVDIFAMLLAARDGHLTWQGDVLGAFAFLRTTGGLAAVSADGQQTPQIYHYNDLVTQDAETLALKPVTGYTPSPVEAIDGIDVVTFLLSQSLVANSQDPDALWNQAVVQLGREGDVFQIPTFYPGPSTNLTFANGTTNSYPNVAVVVASLDGITTGEDAYAVFCPGAVESSTSSAAATSALPTSSSAASTVSTAAPASPTISSFPYPVIKDSNDMVAGYYLNDTGLTDVAVLQITAFEPSGVSDNAALIAAEQEFQDVLQKFLDAAVRMGKQKLIIDLRANGGGIIDLGIDTFGQLFPPQSPPNSKSNMRDNMGLFLLGDTLANNISASYAEGDIDDAEAFENIFTPLTYQTIMSPDVKNFPDWPRFYGPVPLYGGNFSSFFQNNYTNLIASDFEGTGIVITGTNNRTGFRQPFAAQDVVVLYDGYCGSTCTVFSEYLKNYAGVQFIAVGGRPQTGPMQAVGGVKGSQIFDLGVFETWLSFWESQDAILDQITGTIWENFTDDPILRLQSGGTLGVNGRNHFRVGDQTETPLQYVYEAADCRIWWTHEMMYDATFVWKRAAIMAFQERKGTQFNSQYCIQDSTGHPTSISGGWQKGTLGPQTPPSNAQSTVDGWALNGDSLGATTPETMAKSTEADSPELTSIKQACTSYSGSDWLVQVICGALSS